MNTECLLRLVKALSKFQFVSQCLKSHCFHMAFQLNQPEADPGGMCFSITQVGIKKMVNKYKACFKKVVSNRF